VVFALWGERFLGVNKKKMNKRMTVDLEFIRFS